MHGRMVPRALFVDSQPPMPCHELPLFHPRRLLGDAGLASNGTFASVSASPAGRALATAAADRARALAENCDRLGAVVLTMSPAGGTGGGLSSLLLELVEEELGAPTTVVHASFPAAAPSSAAPPIALLNTVLTMPSLLEHADLVAVTDNAALLRLCDRELGVRSPTFAQLDAVAALPCCALTAPSRLAHGGASLQEVVEALTPYPALHFVVPSVAPLASPDVAPYECLSVRELVARALAPQAAMATSVPSSSARSLAEAWVWRGDGAVASDISVAEARASSAALRRADWAGSAATFAVAMAPMLPACSPCASLRRSATLMSNTSGWGASSLRSLLSSFNAVLRSRAHVCHFVAEGMEMEELEGARSQLVKLSTDYACASAETVPAPSE